MRILIINTYYYPEIVGGAEYSVKKLAEGLKKEGHEVLVLCTGDEFKDEYVNNVHVIRFRTKNICRVIKSGNEPRWKRQIRTIQDVWNPLNEKVIDEIIESFEPDVVHTNGLFDITPVVWKIAKQNNVRVVHTLRDYMMCCPKVSLECEYRSGVCTMPRLFCKYHQNMNKIHSKYVDFVTAPSNITLSTVISRGYFKDARKLVVPNATDFDINKVTSILNWRKSKRIETFRFVYLGTLSEKKGIKWLLNSFSEVKESNAELYIAGKGDLEQLVANYAYSDKRIKYVGFLDSEKVGNLLDKCDVLICPSIWSEPFGRVVLDAYSHAMPVIASDSGALKEIVIDNKTGHLVKSNNINDLRKNIEMYIQGDYPYIDEAECAVKELSKYSINNQINCFVNLVYSGK